jgi:hypothetical protein
MSAWRIAQVVAVGVFLALCGAFVWGSLQNSSAITEVDVRLKPGGNEPGDHHLLGVGHEDKLPDYTLNIRTKDGWDPIGTRRNTSAADWLKFPVANGIPVRRAAELQLVEDDTVENDVLEQLPIEGLTLSGKQFDFRLTTEDSFEAGMDWFFDTPPGKAISLGITLAVLAFILALIGPILPL